MEAWVPTVGVIGVSLVGSAIAFHKYRYGDRKVICWFCNQSTVVPVGNVNCWDCPHCEQYNGFNQDGGYNKCIPSQYSEDMNHVVTCQSQDYLGSTATLCSTCQQNQQMKIRSLSLFQPRIEENYDVEVEEFKKMFERNNPICTECQIRVDRELQKQNKMLQQKLLGTKFELSANLEATVCSTTTFLQEVETVKPILRTLFTVLSGMSTVISLILFLNSCFHLNIFSQHFQENVSIVMFYFMESHVFFLVIMATLSALLSKLIIGINRFYVIDSIDSLTWLLLLGISSKILPQWMCQDLPVFIIHFISTTTTFCCLVKSRSLSKATSSADNRLSLDKSTSSEASTLISSVSTSQKTKQETNSQPNNLNPVQDLDGLNFDVCSIGPKSAGSKDSGIYSWTGSACSLDTVSSLPNIQPGVRHRRPLISPAKLQFNPSPNTNTFGQPPRDPSAPTSLFSNATVFHEEKLHLFGNMTIPEKQPKLTNIQRGIQTPSLFQNINLYQSKPMNYNKTYSPKKMSLSKRDEEVMKDTRLTTEKLSMFNIQQSLIRPKIFENACYLSNPYEEEISMNVVTGKQLQCESIPTDCGVDSTTNPKEEQMEQSSSINSGRRQTDSSWKHTILLSTMVVCISVLVNIAIHYTCKEYIY